MKIYILTINQVDPDPPTMIPSNYRAPRTAKKIEYFLYKDDAEKRKKEIYESTQKLLGWLNGVEVVITEAEAM